MATTTLEKQTSVLERPLWSVIALDWEKALYGVLILAAFVTRFYSLGARVMSHDESLHTQFAWYLYQGRGFQHTPLMHGPLKFELTAFMYWLLGDNDFTARIPSALMGVAAVGLMYFFRKWLGRTGALVAALFMLISPYMLYYARYIRDEPYVMVWGLLVALCVLNYMDTRATKYLYWLAAISALFYATMESSFIYIAISMLFLGLHLVYELLAVSWPRSEYRRPFELAIFFTLIALAVTLGFFLYSRQAGTLTGAETAVPANPDESEFINPCQAAGAASPYSQFVLWGGVAAAAGLVAGTYFIFRAFGNEIRRFPALDLLVVMGVFVLPQLTAFPVRALCRNPINYTLPSMQGLSFTDRILAFLSADAGITLIVFFILLAISIVVGWVWDAKRFLICAGIFYGLYIPLFTTFFTNGGGILTGLIGSLGYWLEQHGVRRGNQPTYYYALINLPVYEFLPVIGALLALGLGIRRWLFDERTRQRVPISPADTLGFPAILYFGFWAVTSIVAFSIAGEKMPWLTTHMTLPLILLSGWSIGQFIDRTGWQLFRERRAWLVAVILPVTVTAIAALFGSLLGATPPLQGSELPQLQATGVFISALLISAMGLIGIYYLGRDLGWGNVARLGVLSLFGLLALLTARAAFIASYVNYDYANEFLVYAHGARGVKTVMRQIEDISERTTDGLGLKVAYDHNFSWPGSWYLRNYTNQAYFGAQPTREALRDAPVVIAGPDTWDKVEALLGDRYYKFEYIRMVWPMQDYFGIKTWRNVQEGLIIAPGHCRSRETYPNEQERIQDETRLRQDCAQILGGVWTNKNYRQALWNIWFNRDYTLYGQLTNQNFDLSQWPVAERMHLYVRKDIAGQIWSYGVGPSVLTEAVQEDPYVKSRQVIQAERVWGSKGAAPSQFDGPRAVAVAPDGSVYVADSRNHRIQKFDADGNLLLTWGSFGSIENNTAEAGKFNEPWGVAVGPDGSVYVADTWNHRVQKFDANGKFLTMWGHFGQAETLDAFWGPRAVAVDSSGRIFVVDTGNKRISVFDENGAALLSIGSGGFEPGFLDEPVGVAVSPDDAVYVADTWNQRIQVFQLDASTGEYIFAKEWPIVGWYGQSLENKPYLAVDAQGQVYVTDPEGYRVLVFDKDGQFITTWGDFGADAATFALAAGIAVDSNGNVYVADAGENNRVLKFPPLK